MAYLAFVSDDIHTILGLVIYWKLDSEEIFLKSIPLLNIIWITYLLNLTYLNFNEWALSAVLYGTRLVWSRLLTIVMIN